MTKGRKIKWAEKVSIGVKKLWEDEEYRTKQTEQRKQKRGKYRDGIIKPLRLELPSEKINQLYKDGKTINEISKLLGVSFYTIKRRIEFGE
jgi:DNA invertase Pin-like site-specific DNA recombinase